MYYNIGAMRGLNQIGTVMRQENEIIAKILKDLVALGAAHEGGGEFLELDP